MLQDGVARVGRYVVNGDKVFQGIGTALAAMYKCEPRPQADHPLVDGFSALRWSAVRGLFSFTAGLVHRTRNPLALDLETACGGLNMLIEHSDSFRDFLVDGTSVQVAPKCKMMNMPRGCATHRPGSCLADSFHCLRVGAWAVWSCAGTTGRTPRETPSESGGVGGRTVSE